MVRGSMDLVLKSGGRKMAGKQVDPDEKGEAIFAPSARKASKKAKKRSPRPMKMKGVPGRGGKQRVSV